MSSQPSSEPKAAPGAAPAAPGATAAAAAASVQDLIRTLQDASQPLAARKKAIRALAKNGSDEAFAALKQALQNSPQEVRVAIAEALGECPNPESGALLRSLLNDPSEAVARGAVRGLATQGSAEAAASLAQLVGEPARSVNLREEAAFELGRVNQPGVLGTLTRAATSPGEEAIVEAALKGIGLRDIKETESFYQNYLRSPNADTELKKTAVGGLSEAQGDPSRFLAGVAGDKSFDPEVRGEAAWALSATETSGTAGAQVLELLGKETDADVRRRLYEALGNQETYDIAAVQAAVPKETDMSARVSGWDLLAQTVAQAQIGNPSPELQAFFDQTAVPDLKQRALTAESQDARMAALIALKRARTPGALAAVGELAGQAQDPRVLKSAQKTFAPKSGPAAPR